MPPTSPSASTVSTVPTSTIHRLTARVDALTEKAKRPLIHAWIPPPPSLPLPPPAAARTRPKKGEGKKKGIMARRVHVVAVRPPRCRGVPVPRHHHRRRHENEVGEGEEGDWESISSDDGDGSEISWGPDSPLTAALRRQRNALIAPPSPPSPVSSGSTGLTQAEEELRELEEQVKDEIARRGLLVRRLLATRADHGRRRRKK